MTARKPAVPRGLDLIGSRLWRDVLAKYALRVDEVLTLESACRTADTIVRLDAAMTGQPLTVKGSMGQLREHPLLAEIRQQRGLLSRLLTQLKLPEDEMAQPLTRSTAARAAAQGRWSK